MDEIVKAALAKWPNVPHCYGWLGMDARGDYYMRDDACQRAGPFQRYRQHPQAKGSRITHDKLLAFIHRNYGHDERGAWFFQNGPQRVYVELEATPFVYRLHDADGSRLYVEAQTGQRTESIHSLLSDEEGRLFATTDLGLGLIHSQDMWLASERLSSRLGALTTTTAELLPRQYGFIRSPILNKQHSAP